MTQIKVLTQRSILVVLLVSNTFNPLLAFSVKSHPLVKRNQQVSSIFQKVKNILVQKGLEHDAAIEKTTKLFQAEDNTLHKINYLFDNSELSLSKESLIEELAKYALYEKKLDLNSYSSLVGLTQSVLSRPLNKTELEHIQYINAS